MFVMSMIKILLLLKFIWFLSLSFLDRSSSNIIVSPVSTNHLQLDEPILGSILPSSSFINSSNTDSQQRMVNRILSRSCQSIFPSFDQQFNGEKTTFFPFLFFLVDNRSRKNHFNVTKELLVIFLFFPFSLSLSFSLISMCHMFVFCDRECKTSKSESLFEHVSHKEADGFQWWSSNQ